MRNNLTATSFKLFEDQIELINKYSGIKASTYIRMLIDKEIANPTLEYNDLKKYKAVMMLSDKAEERLKLVGYLSSDEKTQPKQPKSTPIKESPKQIDKPVQPETPNDDDNDDILKGIAGMM